MKKLITILFLGMVVMFSAFADPPPEMPDNPTQVEFVVAIDHEVSSPIILDTASWEVCDVGYLQNLATNTGYVKEIVLTPDEVAPNLYASIIAQSDSEPPNDSGTVEEDSGGSLISKLINSKGWEKYFALILAVMAIFRVIVRMTPTEKDNKIFNFLDGIITGVIPNKKTGGGIH